MADIETAGGRGTALLPGAHRVIRALDAKEGPYAGTLVTTGDGVAVRVDAATLSGWAGWRYSGAEHVAAPIDVGRRSGGQDVLLPWCTDRVLGFLVRRSAAGEVLTPGECSTVVISLLRGLDELGEGVEGVRSGVWWLTDGGRPVFVFGVGSDARAGAAEIVGRLAENVGDKMRKRVLDVVERGLRETADHPRLPRKLLDAWEQELASIAAPQPLERATHAPVRGSELARAASTHDLLALRGGRRAALRSDRRLRADHVREVRGLVARGAELSDAVRAGVGSILARAAGPPGVRSVRGSAAADKGDIGVPVRRRRMPLIIAGGVAAVVLAVGLLWPSGGVPGETADAAGRSEMDTPDGARVGTEQGGPATTGPSEADGSSEAARARQELSSGDDPVSAASALLKTIADCREHGDTSCAAGVASGSAGVIDALVVAEHGNPRFELVDDYGGVAVLHLDVADSAGEPGQDDADAPTALIVVLLRADEKWLVRDVYDVADQPG